MTSRGRPGRVPQGRATVHEERRQDRIGGRTRARPAGRVAPMGDVPRHVASQRAGAAAGQGGRGDAQAAPGARRGDGVGRPPGGVDRGRRGLLAGRGRRLLPHDQPGRVREHQARHPRRRVGHRRQRRPTIQGFATDISVNAGSTIEFKIKTPANATRSTSTGSATTAGNGARKVASVTPSASLPQNQPAASPTPTTEIVDCGNWAVSASWAVPATAVSGVYLRQAHPHRHRRREPHHLRRAQRRQHVGRVFQTSDTTWQAYNTYGGVGLLPRRRHGRAYKLSYNRPFATRGGTDGRDCLFSNEYPMIRFLERNGYDVSYTTGVDTDRRGNLIKNHKRLPVGRPRRVLVGHPAGQRRGRPRRRGQPGLLQRQRGLLEDPLGAQRGRHQHALPDPGLLQGDVGRRQDRPEHGVDRHLARPPVQPAGRRRPAGERADRHHVTCPTADDLAVHGPAGRGQAAALAGTAVNSIPAGQSGTLAPHTVGYESDEDLDNGFRPAGLIRLSTTTGATPEYLRDFGATVDPGHDDPPPDALRAQQRRPGLLRRHHPVGAGDSTTTTTARRPRRHADAAGRPSTSSPTWACSQRR